MSVVMDRKVAPGRYCSASFSTRRRTVRQGKRRNRGKDVARLPGRGPRSGCDQQRSYHAEGERRLLELFGQCIDATHVLIAASLGFGLQQRSILGIHGAQRFLAITPQLPETFVVLEAILTHGINERLQLSIGGSHHLFGGLHVCEARIDQALCR